MCTFIEVGFLCALPRFRFRFSTKMVCGLNTPSHEFEIALFQSETRQSVRSLPYCSSLLKGLVLWENLQKGHCTNLNATVAPVPWEESFYPLEFQEPRRWKLPAWQRAAHRAHMPLNFTFIHTRYLVQDNHGFESGVQ